MKMLEIYRENGIENILALRGDIPQDGKVSTDYRYAVELIRDIRENGDFCIGGACYPEGHTESASKKEDLQHLKEKADAGLSFLTTQMFFNNDIFYNFLYRALEQGSTIPVIAAMKQAGIVYASEQIIDLIANGIRHIHVYTMNKPDVAEGIMKNLSSILESGGRA